jgi:hypothetical protein
MAKLKEELQLAQFPILKEEKQTIIVECPKSLSAALAGLQGVGKYALGTTVEGPWSDQGVDRPPFKLEVVHEAGEAVKPVLTYNLFADSKDGGISGNLSVIEDAAAEAGYLFVRRGVYSIEVQAPRDSEAKLLKLPHVEQVKNNYNGKLTNSLYFQPTHLPRCAKAVRAAG